jgi:cell division protein FtsB
VYAEGADLDLLETEVQILLANRDRLAQATGYAADYIESRCRNFLRAIAQARALCGGVYIG